MMGAEAIKCHLSEVDLAEGEIDGLDLPGGRTGKLAFAISRRQFEDAVSGYIHRTIEVTRGVIVAAGYDVRDVSDVLCVGGSTRVPIVRQRLADLFGRPPNTQINPDEVVAQGAAIQAGSLTALAAGTGMGARDAVATAGHSTLGRGGKTLPMGVVKRPILMDVNPATLAIQTVGGFTERLLEKNAPIPIERKRVFTTGRDQQTRVEIDCCRGEDRKYVNNEPLGTLVLDDLPAKPRGELEIEVAFRIDADGILHVSAADPESGLRQEAHLQVLGAPATVEPGEEPS
jgi:molecular chaperone DnaK